MRAIVDGLLYDTDKSDLLVSTSSTTIGTGRVTNFLYRSPNLKRFFVVKREESLMIGTPEQSIRPLKNQDEAIQWLYKMGVTDLQVFKGLGVEIREA